MAIIADFGTLNPIYHYLPYCTSFREEIDPVTHKKSMVVEYRKTYPPFPWKRDGNAHENEDPIAFINACAEQGLVQWETKEQERERLYRERPYGETAPVSYEEYLRIKGESNEN